MMNTLSTLTRGLAAVALLTATAAGEPIENPISETVPQADIRVDLELVADEHMVSPVWGTNAGDDSGRLFIVDQAGKIFILQDGELRDEPYLDLSETIVELQRGFDERGLLGLAFHPDFANEGEPGYGKFYTYSSEPLDAHDEPEFNVEMPEGVPLNHVGVLSEWQLEDHTADSVNPDDRRVVLTVAQPQFNHDGGATLFGPDGMLYLSLGDGGAGNDIGPGHTPEIGNGQDATNILGSIIRIDPLGRDSGKGYAVPQDNPFVGDDEKLDVIYAYGLRNAFLMSFDGDTLIAADVGQQMIEEVNIIEAGGNYGWNLKEGTFYFETSGAIYSEPLPDRPVPDDLIDPVVQYDHDDGTSIMGGFVYRGSAIPELEGLYVFADWQNQVPDSDRTSGRLFISDLKAGTIHAMNVGDGDSYIGHMVTGFAEDQDGEIYVLTNRTTAPQGEQGRVWKIVPHGN